ncbi:hypothetical protein [Nocardioides pantholopis]|uniref:hypothetical protein n=1 Tax=Nocardioides pantholopis TaxID=2483798 RepID=UPI000FD704A8|nr:hypothetical protein [Nocardioides pantholopis]
MTSSPSAKERAQDAAGTAAEEGKHVAGTAAEEARNVAAEAAGQARSVLNDALGQVSEQSRAQQERLAGTLQTFGDDLEQMAGQGSPGLATDLTREVATRARGFASQLQDREPSQLLEDVRGFARRRPGAFLLGALTAGVVAGRLARGTADGIAAATGSGSGVGSASASMPPSTGTSGMATPVGSGQTTAWEGTTGGAGTTNPPMPSTTPGQPTVAPPLDAPGPMGGPQAGYGERGAFDEPSGERGVQ